MSDISNVSPEVVYRIQNLMWVAVTIAFIIASSFGTAYLARFIARWRGLSEQEERKVFNGFLFAGPWLVGFFIFVAGPALASLYYGFTSYKIGDATTTFIGLDNYRTMILG